MPKGKRNPNQPTSAPKTNGKKAPPKVDGRSKAAREAKKGAAATNGIGHNGDRDTADAVQANFIQHRSRWIICQSKLKTVEKELKDMVAAAKADGFKKKQFEIADGLTANAKSEAKVVGTVTETLQVARWIGHAIGKQFDLFENPSAPVPTEEAAYQDGKRAAMEGQNATPPTQYGSGTLEQRWLSGWHEGQEARVKAGIKPLAAQEKNPPAGWGASAQIPAAARGDTDL